MNRKFMVQAVMGVLCGFSSVAIAMDSNYLFEYRIGKMRQAGFLGWYEEYFIAWMEIDAMQSSADIVNAIDKLMETCKFVLESDKSFCSESGMDGDGSFTDACLARKDPYEVRELVELYKSIHIPACYKPAPAHAQALYATYLKTHRPTTKPDSDMSDRKKTNSFDGSKSASFIGRNKYRMLMVGAAAAGVWIGYKVVTYYKNKKKNAEAKDEQCDQKNAAQNEKAIA